MRKPYSTLITEHVNIVIDAPEVACVYCGGALLSEECSANPVSVNYVRNKKFNNLYSNTYNPLWRNNPKFS